MSKVLAGVKSDLPTYEEMNLILAISTRVNVLNSHECLLI